MPTLSSPAFALLQGWKLDKDKSDVLLSKEIAPVQGAVLEHNVNIGRLGEGATASDAFIHISDSKAISRQHASLAWDAASSHWTIACLSKNGLSLNAKPLKPDTGSVPLQNGDKLRIGPVYLVFTLPIPEKTGKSALKSAPPPHLNDKGTPNSSINGAANVGVLASSSGSSNNNSGRPATGGGGIGSGLGKYALMIHAAFTAARQEGACASDGSLSKQDVVDRCLLAQPDLAEASKRKLLLKQLGEQLQKRAIPALNPPSSDSNTADSTAGSAGSGGTSLSKRWYLPDDFLTATKPPATSASSAATTTTATATTLLGSASAAGPPSGSHKRKAPDDNEQGSRGTVQHSNEDPDVTVDLTG